MATNKEKCVWKTVSENDLEKIARGDSFITLGPNKPCYKCEGTKEYARKINCKNYLKDVGE